MVTEVFARHVFPVDSKPLENGLISIADGRIKGVAVSGRPSVSGGNSGRLLIIPGLVNAHTHLDLTDMGGEVGRGKPFTEWIKEVIAWRQNRNEDEIRGSINRGVDLSLRGGTTCLGDYSSSGASCLSLNNAGIKGRVFLEVTGLKEELAAERVSMLETKLSLNRKYREVLPGIAPHAPYSVSPSLISSCSDMARREGLPLSMHVGEVSEELEFLHGKEGEMEELLKFLNVWGPRFKAPLKGGVEYLFDIGVLNGMALVHLNFITPHEVEMLRSAGCSAIFCPGSHGWFGRQGCAPVGNLLAAGVNIALGSDGLSSNSSLNMFREMRLMKRMFPEISSFDVLKMATLNGAAALSLDDVTGSLTPGKDADLVGLNCPESVSDPLDLLFDDRVSVKFVMSRGKIVYGALP